jgi:murein DD-endopeptidase MepM/ murein hydrolase activator NlpD
MVASLADALLTQIQLEQSLRDNGTGQVALQGAVQENQGELSRLDGQIASRDAQIKETRRRIDTERRLIGVLARAIYRQPDSLLVRMLQAGSLRQALVEGADLASAARRGQALQDDLKADLARLDKAQAQQQADRQRRQDLSTRQIAAMQSLQQLQGDQQGLSQKLISLIAATRVALAQVSQQRPDLAQRIAQQLQTEEAQLAASAMRLAWEQVMLWQQVNPTAPVAASQGHSTRFRFIWPLPHGVVTQGYGPTDLYLEPSFAGFAHFHTGIDIAEPAGTPVLAADDGVVAVVGNGSTGYGNYVVLAHGDGVMTLYGHLQQALVTPGAHVQQGQPIGLEGSTGNSTGPHCHFEVRVNDQFVDPTHYLPPGAPSPSRD